MHYAHHIHADDPVPVLERVLPDEATRADTGVVKQPVRRAETGLSRGRERIDLFMFGNIHALRQNLHASGDHFVGSGIESSLLNVG